MGKVAKYTPYLHYLQVQRYLFYISKLNNAVHVCMMAIPSLHHKHHVVLFIFSIFYLKQDPGWLNELGSWITYKLIQAYNQYGVGSLPAL